MELMVYKQQVRSFMSLVYFVAGIPLLVGLWSTDDVGFIDILVNLGLVGCTGCGVGRV